MPDHIDLETAAREFKAACGSFDTRLDRPAYDRAVKRLHSAAILHSETGGWRTDLDRAQHGKDYDVTVESEGHRAVVLGRRLRAGDWVIDTLPGWDVIAFRECHAPYTGPIEESDAAT